MSADKGDSLPPDDLQLQVVQEGDETRISALLDKPADYCYRLFCNADDIPGWLWVVGRAVVQQRDAQGRATEVDFMGSLKRASIAYSLSYSYDDEQLEVRWHRRRVAALALGGSARFAPLDPQSCRLHYTLHSELSQGLPRWDDKLYHSRPAEAVVLDFIEWVDQQWEQRTNKADKNLQGSE